MSYQELLILRRDSEIRLPNNYTTKLSVRIINFKNGYQYYRMKTAQFNGNLGKLIWHISCDQLFSGYKQR